MFTCPLLPVSPPAELDSEHAQKVLDMEHAQQGKLKERQKYFEEAFQQDMDQYLSTGYLQITDRRGELEPRTHTVWLPFL